MGPNRCEIRFSVSYMDEATGKIRGLGAQNRNDCAAIIRECRRCSDRVLVVRELLFSGEIQVRFPKRPTREERRGA